MSFYLPWGATGTGRLFTPDEFEAQFPLAPRTVEWFRANTLGRRRGAGIDFFAGGGGFSIGAVLAGLDLRLAANHATISYDTHSENFPDTEHVLGDLSVIDPKRYAKNLANILVCAPECRTFSVARNWIEAISELAPWDPRRETERSRCTMWCPQRFAAWMQFDHVIVENVVDVATWNRFDDWLVEWDKLGYVVQLASLNSAFFGNEQSRNRLFAVATRKGLELPNLDFRPPAYCWACERLTPGVQTWKRAALARATRVGPVGSWGPRGQYVYRCEACHEVVSPYILPACGAIDWSIEAPAIGDRDRLGLEKLEPTTMRRLELALTRVGYVEQLSLSTGRPPETQRSRPVWLPSMTQTTRQEIALMGPPAEHSLVYMRNNVLPTSMLGPALTVCASGNHHGLMGTPGAHPHPADAMLAAYNGSGHNSRTVEAPAATVVASDRLALLVPEGGAGREEFAPVRPPRNFDLRDATYRMLQAHEAVRLMGMHERPDGTPYKVAGKGRQVVRQAGNAIVAILAANIADRVMPPAA